MRLSDLIGQKKSVEALQNALRRGRVAHAYLFVGPDRVGKSTAAKLFAKTLGCEKVEAFEPCDECRSCRLIEKGNHPDVRLITLNIDESGKRRTEISIDQIRQNPKKPRATPPPLIQDAYLRPILAEWKVYLIDPAERMSDEASNALLKLLEEPPPYVVLILVTSEPSALLPTVVSRCQQIAFRLAGTEEVERRLVELGISSETAASIARLSGGRAAWAIEAVKRPEVLSVRKSLLDLCHSMRGRDMQEALRVAEHIKEQAFVLAEGRMAAEFDEGEEAEEGDSGEREPVGDRALRAELPWCLDVIVTWYRDLLSVRNEGALLNPDYEDKIKQSVQSYSSPLAECIIGDILEMKSAIQHNANIDIALESLAIDMIGGCN